MKKEIYKIIQKYNKNKNFNININLLENNFIDSLNIIAIVSELEKKFKIKFKNNIIKADNFSYIKKIEQIIKKLNNNI